MLTLKSGTCHLQQVRVVTMSSLRIKDIAVDAGEEKVSDVRSALSSAIWQNSAYVLCADVVKEICIAVPSVIVFRTLPVIHSGRPCATYAMCRNWYRHTSEGRLYWMSDTEFWGVCMPFSLYTCYVWGRGASRFGARMPLVGTHINRWHIGLA
jgi:hypothetical protein